MPSITPVPTRGRARKLAAASAVLTTALLAPAPVASARAPGRIVFVSERDGNSELYSMPSDGTSLTRLTSTPQTEIDPALSPDGSRIAFTRITDGNADLYVMDVDGGNVRPLAAHTGSDRYPTWSPDGSRIAFRSNRSKSFEIYSVRLDGTGLQRLTDNEGFDSDPFWARDGRIVFVSDRSGTRDIWAMGPDGRNQTLIARAPGGGQLRFPAESPDDSQIAFAQLKPTGGYEMDLMGADGTGATQLAASPISATDDDSSSDIAAKSYCL